MKNYIRRINIGLLKLLENLQLVFTIHTLALIIVFN